MFKDLFVKDDLKGKDVPAKQSCQCGDMVCKGGASCKKKLSKANPQGINQYTRQVEHKTEHASAARQEQVAQAFRSF